MILYSTRNSKHQVTLREAVLRGLPPDNGLYMPVRIPRMPAAFLRSLRDHSFQEIAFRVSEALFDGYLPEAELEGIIERSITFPAPVVSLDQHRYVLELFHGPSLAFKDFGARFMAQLMSYFNRGENQELTILVATSGDTGGAVAAGFFQAPGIKVVILYPSGKVSPLQEKQLTTLGGNVSALEIEGSFDDCQALVKQAFLDEGLAREVRLSSANSINIARLIPQSFYYFEAFKQLPPEDRPLAFSVPSGNFGNLTAGLLAHRMGLPVDHFVAATNVNDVVPRYLHTGDYEPHPSVRTISNAMDVGNPSNFARMLDLFAGSSPEGGHGSTWNNMRAEITGFGFNDHATRLAMREVYEDFQYIMDPHGAIGYLALNAFLTQHPLTRGIILETAHPAKFKEEVDAILGIPTPVPERLAILADRKKEAARLPNEYRLLREWLLDNR